MERFSLKSVTSAIVVIVFLAACYYDKEEILYPGSTNCTDNLQPTFKNDVLPLLNSKCNSCHKGTYASAGIRLDSYEPVKSRVSDGSLMGSIKHISGYSAMPQNGSQLSTCEVNNIQAWIDGGALNN